MGRYHDDDGKRLCTWGILDPGNNPHFGRMHTNEWGHDLCVRFFRHKGHHYTATGAAIDREGNFLDKLHGRPDKFLTDAELDYYGWYRND